jgi:hypothetical protein
MKNSSRGLNEMVGESAAAQSAGNAGMQPATHTVDAAPRPGVLARRLQPERK